MTSCSVTSFKKAISSVQGRLCSISKSEQLNPKLPYMSGRGGNNVRTPSVSRSFEQCKVATVRTTWQHVRTLFRVREDSSIQVHPSRQRGYTVRTLVRVRVQIGFHVQTQIGKQQPSGRKGNTVLMVFRFLGRFLHTSQCFYHNSLLKYRIETKLVSLKS
jgi:hypothetical protein